MSGADHDSAEIPGREGPGPRPGSCNPTLNIQIKKNNNKKRGGWVGGVRELKDHRSSPP